MNKRRIIAAVLLLIFAICFTGCHKTPGLYQLDDIIPKLMDTKTQYPYTTSVVVEKDSTGERLDYTEGTDHDKIRMQFEGIKCYRDKLTESDDYEDGVQYTVTFVTTDGEVAIEVISKDTCIIDGYVYHAMTSGIDILFFDNLFVAN